MKRILSSALLLAAGAASAHTGHLADQTTGSLIDSLRAGLEHPLGADHLLAMVAVGAWSVMALPAQRAWQGPAMFMAALVISAALGAAGISVPGLEMAIAASVSLFGLMFVWLAVPAAHRLPSGLGLILVAAAASLHGLAHGAEAPLAGSFAGYALGFLLTSAALHFGGVLAGWSLRRWLAERATQVMAGFGLALGGAGAYLLSQV